MLNYTSESDQHKTQHSPHYVPSKSTLNYGLNFGQNILKETDGILRQIANL